MHHTKEEEWKLVKFLNRPKTRSLEKARFVEGRIKESVPLQSSGKGKVFVSYTRKGFKPELTVAIGK